MDGIELEFDDDGARVKKPSLKKTECFGGVMCEYCKSQPKQFSINDHKKIEALQLFCDEAEKSVVDLFYESGCPHNRWVKAAVGGFYAEQYRDLNNNE